MVAVDIVVAVVAMVGVSVMVAEGGHGEHDAAGDQEFGGVGHGYDPLWFRGNCNIQLARCK